MYLSRIVLKLACVVSIFTCSTIQAADKWRFEIAPYLWAINMNGDVQIASRGSHVNESFSDLMKNFKGGGMLWLSADKNKFGLFANAIYASLSKDTPISIFTIKSTAKLGIFSAGASYAVYERKYASNANLRFEPYLGLRYTMNNASVSIEGTSLSAKNDQHWTDPILGARMKYNNRGWRLLLAGDIGGTNFNTDKSINLNAVIGYNPQTTMQCVTFYLGYKYLYQKYINGSGIDYFAWNMRLFGPVLGFGVSF